MMNNREEHDSREPDPRKAALAAVIPLLLLLVAGLALIHRLKATADIEDCLMSGGKRCAPSASP